MHKTGTIGGTANNVGIVTLPDDAGHVAIAVFVKSSEKELSARERTIAEIARSVYDFFCSCGNRLLQHNADLRSSLRERL